MLKYTRVELEAMCDIKHILFTEQNIRGGVSFINQRLCKDGLQKNALTDELAEYIQMLYIDGMFFK